MNVEKQIIQKLKDTLNAREVVIEDQSRLHQGHSEAAKSGGGHYTVIVVSDDFNDKTALERHRMVYGILKEEFKDNDIHALSLRALTSREHNDSRENPAGKPC